jgi:hypothetical protein
LWSIGFDVTGSCYMFSNAYEWWVSILLRLTVTSCHQIMATQTVIGPISFVRNICRALSDTTSFLIDYFWYLASSWGPFWGAVV